MIKETDIQVLKTLSRALIKKNETLSVAESVTAGMLQCSIAEAPYAMQFFQGGITAYNVPQKYKHLHVEPVHAQSVNAVSEQVALQMAQEVCNLFCSDWGISITGYASPVPESDYKLFAYFAIVKSKKLMAKGKLTALKQPAKKVQQYYVSEVLKKLFTAIKK